MLSHYHEAAYDAHMTGFAFAYILKLKELDSMQSRGNKKNNSLEKKMSDMSLNGEVTPTKRVYAVNE